MIITVNNKEIEIETGKSLQALLDDLDFQNNSTAVILNGQKLWQCNYNTTVIKEGDNLKLLTIFIGG